MIVPDDQSITFEKLNDTTNEIEDVITITEFEFDTNDAHKRQLPSDIRFEVRIRESLLLTTDLTKVCSLRHQTTQGVTRFHIQRPTQYWPSGLNRQWVFWLEAAEVIISTTGDFLIDDAGDFLIDDAGNSIVWDGI